MEFTEVSEKRFERVRECLFSGNATPAASSAGLPSPANKKKEDQQNMSGLALQAGEVVELLLASHGCRPWDRGDLLRRLATYKSISWFGKPQVAGPVACARTGWVNADIDLLACETCGSRLSFPVSSSWPRDQVERAALAFAEQLDTAHKGLCTWKNNPCAETLASFPPTPIADLRRAYIDRCEALLHLSALPVISETAKYQMKLSRGPQVDQLLSEPSLSDPEHLFGNGVSSSSSRNGSFAADKGFYQAQRMIAVCGWEPRLLCYTVDREDRSGPQCNEQTGTSQGPGPSVTVHLKGDLQAKNAQNEIQPDADASDPASAVLDCNLCGASVGLWNFTTVNRPASLLDSGLKEILSPNKNQLEPSTVRLGTDDVVDGTGLAMTGAADVFVSKAPEAVLVNVLKRVAPQKGLLDLKLTIAGGPPPTSALVPPSLGASGLLDIEVQPNRSKAATYDKETDDVERRKDAGTQVEDGLFLRNAKRKREEGLQWPCLPMKHPVRDLPHASSVNAIDSSYLQKQENLMESVDKLPPYSDGQCANTAEYHGNGPKSVVHSISHEYDNRAVQRKCDETVRSGGSSEAEIHGMGAHLDRSESVAEFTSDVTELMEEFVSGRGLMDDFVSEEEEKVDVKDNREGSQQAMFGISGTFFKDSLSVGVDERCRGKGSQRDSDEDANAESIRDTTNAVNQGHDVDANFQVKEITDGQIVEESPVQRNEEAQSHLFFSPGLSSADVRKLEIQTGEFDPILQHRHFCPWVHGHVASATSSTGTGIIRGWQTMLDALQNQHGVPGLAESEHAASKHKDNPLLSVRKFLGFVSSNQPSRA